MELKRVMLDAKMMEEARNMLADHRKMLKKELPNGWELHTLFAPIQYEKTVTLGKRRYIGYLRSRWEYPFSIEIYEKGRGFKLKKLVFSHKSVDMAKNNPPLKSMKIIDRHLEKMKKELGEARKKNI